MKPLIYRVLLLWLCIGLSIGLRASDSLVIHNKEYVRSIKKEYAISPEGEVALNNDHGKVNVKTWEKNRVKVDVKITVHASSQLAADKIFNKIKLNFLNNSSSISAKTTYKQTTSWWSEWIWTPEKDQYSIDYEVHLPKTNSLKLRNRHGDVTVAALKGPVELDLAHCNLKMEEVKEDLSLKFAFGNGTVLQANNAELEVKYGKLIVHEARDIELNSSYSKIQIDKAKDVKSESLHDTYLVGEVDEFINQGKYDNINIAYADKVETISIYTDVMIERVDNRVDFDLKHGGASIIMVSKGFSELNLYGSYADYKVSIEDGASYKINASSDNSGISCPENMKIVYENNKKDNYDLEGYIGNATAHKGVIKAKVSNGGLKVK